MGKKAQAGKPKKPTPKDIGKRLDVLVKKVEVERKDADLFAPLPPTKTAPSAWFRFPVAPPKLAISFVVAIIFVKGALLNTKNP
jgi:hypothetical protein